MADDNVSVHTPTPTELNMFKVMANLAFVDLKRPAPTSNKLTEIDERKDEDIYPDEAIIEELPKIATPLPESPPASPRRNEDFEVQTAHELPHVEPRAETRTEDPYLERAKQMTDAEILAEKEGLLMELQMLEKQGMFKPARPFTLEDSIEELQFQVDRANSNMGAQQAVDFAKTGIRIGSTMMEMFLRKMNIQLLDGFSSNLCKDMNKFNRPLTRLYRKYWRRGGLSSPETELLMIVFGSMAMTVLQNKGTKSFFGPPASAPAPPPAPVATVPQSAPLKPPTFPSFAPPPAAANWAPVPVPNEAFARTVTIGSTPRKPKKESAPEIAL